MELVHFVLLRDVGGGGRGRAVILPPRRRGAAAGTGVGAAPRIDERLTRLAALKERGAAAR
jgi:hypothetical protein